MELIFGMLLFVSEESVSNLEPHQVSCSCTNLISPWVSLRWSEIPMAIFDGLFTYTWQFVFQMHHAAGTIWNSSFPLCKYACLKMDIFMRIHTFTEEWNVIFTAKRSFLYWKCTASWNSSLHRGELCSAQAYIPFRSYHWLLSGA